MTKPTGRPRGPRPMDGISRTTMIGSKITQADLKALRAVMKAKGIPTQSAAVTLAIRAFASANGITVQVVSNEQMKVTGIWGTKSWSPGLTLDQLRDIYEAHVQQLVRERDEALAKVAKAEEALRPFAEGYEQVKSVHTPTWEQRIGENAILFGYCGFDLRIDHLRNAAAVLTPNTPPSNG